MTGRGIEIEIGLRLADHPARLAASRLAHRCRRALVEPQETAPAIAVATAGAIEPPRGLERGARGRRRGALRQLIRLTASSAATL